MSACWKRRGALSIVIVYFFRLFYYNGYLNKYPDTGFFLQNSVIIFQTGLFACRKPVAPFRLSFTRPLPEKVSNFVSDCYF